MFIVSLASLFPRAYLGRSPLRIHRNRSVAVIWEERPNRSIVLSSGSHELPVALFGDVRETGLEHPVSVLFQLDLSEASFNGDPPSGVLLTGGRAPLSWDLDAAEPMMQIGQGQENDERLWQARIRFPEGTLPDIPFKFAYIIDGRTIWEHQPGHINHVFFLDEEALAGDLTLRHKFDPGAARIRAVDSGGMLLNEYDKIAEPTGIRGLNADYPYFHAVALLSAGNSAEAIAAYEAFRQQKPEGAYVDDFYLLWAYDLSAKNRVDEALDLLTEKTPFAPDEYRRGVMEYTRGEILMHHGRYGEAAAVFEDVLQRYAHEGYVVDYANNALGMALHAMGEMDIDGVPAIERAALLLEEVAERNPSDVWQQLALRRLSQIYRETGEVEQAKDAHRRLTQIGTPEERTRAEVELLKRLAWHPQHAEEVMQRLEGLAQRDVAPALAEDLDFVRALAHIHRGELHEAADIAGRMRAERGETALSRILQIRIGQREREEQQLLDEEEF